VETWKRTFLEKLHDAESRCARQFTSVIEQAVVPAFDELAQFLGSNGFKASSPLRDQIRRSFKFELAENAYVLSIFRFAGIGTFELQTETFVPGVKPVSERETGRLADVTREWAQRLFQGGLDRFVELLAGQKSEAPAEELAAV